MCLLCQMPTPEDESGWEVEAMAERVPTLAHLDLIEENRDAFVSGWQHSFGAAMKGSRFGPDEDFPIESPEMRRCPFDCECWECEWGRAIAI